MRNLSRDFEHNMASNLKHNPKAFWSHCKSKLKNRSDLKTDLSDLKTEGGNQNIPKGDLLNQYFASVFIQDNKDNIPDIAEKYHRPDAASITFIIEQIEWSQSIKFPLSIIFQKSSDESCLSM